MPSTRNKSGVWNRESFVVVLGKETLYMITNDSCSNSDSLSLPISNLHVLAHSMEQHRLTSIHYGDGYFWKKRVILPCFYNPCPVFIIVHHPHQHKQRAITIIIPRKGGKAWLFPIELHYQRKTKYAVICASTKNNLCFCNIRHQR